MAESFEIERSPLADFFILTRKPLDDERGWFERFYCAKELAALGVNKPIIQINRSFTQAQGTLRGLHFQHPPNAEIKLVACLQGRVLDVAVDLRKNSPTFLQHHAVELSPENAKTAVIPEGFAHGFQTLSENCILLYLHTAAYAPESEGGINPLDETLAIAWPEPVKFLSDRDAKLPTIRSSF